MKYTKASLVLAAAILAGTAVFAGDNGMNTEKATFAAGCFWGVEKVFGALPGVVSTRVGYTGGSRANPSYEQVCTGMTGHAEAIEIVYDPSHISYEELLENFFRHHDPTTLDRQGPDIGSQYRSAIFFHSPGQKKAAEGTIKVLDDAKIFKKPIVTTLEPASEFYAAEEYHQKYLKKNPHGYCSLQLQSAKIGQVLKEARANS